MIVIVLIVVGVLIYAFYNGGPSKREAYKFVDSHLDKIKSNSYKYKPIDAFDGYNLNAVSLNTRMAGMGSNVQPCYGQLKISNGSIDVKMIPSFDFKVDKVRKTRSSIDPGDRVNKHYYDAKLFPTLPFGPVTYVEMCIFETDGIFQMNLQENGTNDVMIIVASCSAD